MSSAFVPLVAFLLPCGLALLLTPIVRRIAMRVGAVDKPDARKIHTVPTPRLGGLAVAASCAVTALVVVLVGGIPISTGGMLCAAAAAAVAGIGFWDDLRGLPPSVKFAVECAAAAALYAAGVRVSSITHLFGAGSIDLGWFGFPLTILWIVGVTNALNLIDGLDGLTAGVGIIAAGTVCGLAAASGDAVTAVAALVLIGALAGFLPYNFNPAKIFLGDAGSLLIGFSLAALSIRSSTKGSTAVAIGVPLLALGLPIVDTLLAVVRRLLRSFFRTGPSQAGAPAPEEPVWKKLHTLFLPDRRHIHHRLLARGFTQRKAVLLLYTISFTFGLAAVAIGRSHPFNPWLLLTVVGGAILYGIRRLEYSELEVLRSGVLLGLYRPAWMTRPLLYAFCDLLFTAGAAWTAALFAGGGRDGASPAGLSLLPVIALLQMGVLFSAGVYRETIREFGTGDFLAIARGVACAVAVTALALGFFSADRGAWPFTFFVVDFYALLTPVILTRVSFHLLRYAFLRRLEGGKQALIYGADANGLLALQKILAHDAPFLVPLGFLDDDAALEGKRLNGYPIFGGQWKLEGLLRKHRVSHILIASDAIMPESLRRLKVTAARHRLIVKRFTVVLENIPLAPAAPAPAGSPSAGPVPAGHIPAAGLAPARHGAERLTLVGIQPRRNAARAAGGER